MARSRFAQMPAHLPTLVQEYSTEGLVGATCQPRHVTWPDCMPRAHCQASTGQSCLQLSWTVPSIALFLTTCSLPLSVHLMPCRSPLGEWICKG